MATSPTAVLYLAGFPVLQLNPNNFKSKVGLTSRCPLHQIGTSISF
jgi:hypothetical protein